MSPSWSPTGTRRMQSRRNDQQRSSLAVRPHFSAQCLVTSILQGERVLVEYNPFREPG